MVGRTAWIQRRVPQVFVFITDWKVASGVRSMSAPTTTPALFTRMSTRPSARMTEAMPSATDASSSTSSTRSETGSSPAASSNVAPDGSDLTVA